MAQSPIREYDAKSLLYTYLNISYKGIQVKSISDLDQLDDNVKYVIKPDELFGKRGKYGLVGVNLSPVEVKTWLKKHLGSSFILNQTSGILSTFLVEPYTPHSKEYYISIKQFRDYDEISYSEVGGMDIEENWDQVTSLQVGIGEGLTLEQIQNTFGVEDEKILKFIQKLFTFYRGEDFVYLEINPFCFDDISGELVFLDMVTKVDESAYYLHSDTWKNIEFPSPFGMQDTPQEAYIKELDRKTGASLKFKLLNPDGAIWTILAGGGGSLVISDTLGYLGYTKELANYGELSGDPDRYNTYQYTKTVIAKMLESKKAKYLIIAGAIANFTQIDKTFLGMIDVFDDYSEEIKQQGIKILVRRGGLNDKKGLQLLSQACDRLGLDCKLVDGGVYMTDILKEIKL